MGSGSLLLVVVLLLLWWWCLLLSCFLRLPPLQSSRLRRTPHLGAGSAGMLVRSKVFAVYRVYSVGRALSHDHCQVAGNMHRAGR